MPTTETYEWKELAAIAESGRRMEGIEYARRAALRERLTDAFVRARAVADELGEILDDPWLVGAPVARRDT